MSAERRAELCKLVEQIICKDRQDQYGNPEDSHQIIADFWTIYLGITVTALDVTNMMELLKIARRKGQSFNPDNFLDGAGYALIGCTIGEKLNAKVSF